MVHFQIYRELYRTVNTLLFEEKKCFYSTKIKERGKDQKKLFKLTKNLMRSNSNVNLPHFTSAELLADKFSNYFMRKATIIRDKIISDTPQSTGVIFMDADIMFNDNMFEMFRSTSEVEVKEIKIKSWNKSHDLDPLPTCVDQHLPLITAIVNMSMDQSVVSLCLKRTSIIPLLKRPGLDQEEMKNYRPISNLPFIFKLIENVVARHIEEH